MQTAIQKLQAHVPGCPRPPLLVAPLRILLGGAASAPTVGPLLVSSAGLLLVRPRPPPLVGCLAAVRAVPYMF